MCHFFKIKLFCVPSFFIKVSSVPTVIAFKNGKAVKQFIGVQDDDKIEKFVLDLVENSK